MKTLREYLNEDLIPFSGFSLPRNVMPQIKDMSHFLNYLDQLTIYYNQSKQDVNQFKPTQREFDRTKVNRIKKELSKQTKPIIVSEDGYVLDGHHRYFAFKGSDSLINVIEVQLPINKLLKLAIDYTEAYD